MRDKYPRTIWQNVDFEDFPRRWVEAKYYDEVEAKVKELEEKLASFVVHGSDDCRKCNSDNGHRATMYLSNYGLCVVCADKQIRGEK